MTIRKVILLRFLPQGFKFSLLLHCQISSLFMILASFGGTNGLFPFLRLTDNYSIRPRVARHRRPRLFRNLIIQNRQNCAILWMCFLSIYFCFYWIDNKMSPWMVCCWRMSFSIILYRIHFCSELFSTNNSRIMFCSLMACVI